MKRQDIEEYLDAGAGPGSEEHRRITILAVGDVDEWNRHRGTLPVEGNLAFSGFEGITADLIEVLSPQIIMSPLLARGFDCVDLAQLLASIGFSGRYLALSDDLPNPDIIRQEIAHLCPKLDFEIAVVPRDQSRPN